MTSMSEEIAVFEMLISVSSLRKLFILWLFVESVRTFYCKFLITLLLSLSKHTMRSSCAKQNALNIKNSHGVAFCHKENLRNIEISKKSLWAKLLLYLWKNAALCLQFPFRSCSSFLFHLLQYSRIFLIT